MGTRKLYLSSLLTSTVAIVGITLTASAQAQIIFGQPFNRAALTPQQQTAPQPSAGGRLPSGLQASAAPPQQVERGLWPTKAEFLAATRNGDLIGVDKIPDQSAESNSVAASIRAILQSAYGVTLPAGDHACALSFNTDVRMALGAVTYLHRETLTTAPPSYYVAAPKYGTSLVNDMVQTMQGNNGFCDPVVLGVRKPHPYKPALLKLMDEYGQATKDYVEAERSRRQTAYANEQVAKQAQQQAQQQASAAAEQQRIDAERARIQLEQKKRAAQEQNRVGG